MKATISKSKFYEHQEGSKIVLLSMHSRGEGAKVLPSVIEAYQELPAIQHHS